MREITYHKEGDYYITNLYLAEDEYEKIIILESYIYTRKKNLKIK